MAHTPKFLKLVFIVVVASVALTTIRAQMSQFPSSLKEKIKFMTQPKPWWCWLFAKEGVDLVVTNITVSGNQIGYTLRNIGKDFADGNSVTQFCRAATVEEQQYPTPNNPCMAWASDLAASSNISISQTVSQIQFWTILGAGGGGTSITTVQIPGCSSKSFTAIYGSPVSPPVLGHVDYFPNASAGGAAETNTTNNSSIHPPQ